jgi:hypothetical protein
MTKSLCEECAERLTYTILWDYLTALSFDKRRMVG